MNGRLRILMPIGMMIVLCLSPIGLSAKGKEKNASTNTTARLEEYLKVARLEGSQVTAGPGSLWNERAAYVLSDPRARFAGDVVTIVVNESTNAVATAATTGQRSSDQGVQIPSFFGAKVKELPTLLDAKGSSNFSGQGNTTRQTTLTTNISAVVKEVLPNGNMVVEASRDIRINNENQTLTMAGVIRPSDISQINTIASASIAYLDVKLQGKGVVTDHMKPGWLYRLLRGILPF